MSNPVQKNAEYEILDPSVFELIVYGGIIGGIAGGLAFSLIIFILTPTGNFYNLVANLFLETNDTLIGFVVHIGIAITFGIMFGVLLIFIPKLGSSQLITLLTAVVWGFILWVVAANILMPLILNDFSNINEVLSLDRLLSLDTWTNEDALRSFATHMFYGVFLALVTWNLPPLVEKLSNR